MVLDIDRTSTVTEFCLIRLFDAEFGGNELASFTLDSANPNTGDGFAVPVSFPGISGVQRIEFNGVIAAAATGAGYAVDNLSYTVVPEPSASLLAAAGMLGVALRRIRKCAKA